MNLFLFYLYSFLLMFLSHGTKRKYFSNSPTFLAFVVDNYYSNASNPISIAFSIISFSSCFKFSSFNLSSNSFAKIPFNVFSFAIFFKSYAILVLSFILIILLLKIYFNKSYIFISKFLFPVKIISANWLFSIFILFIFSISSSFELISVTLSSFFINSSSSILINFNSILFFF